MNSKKNIVFCAISMNNLSIDKNNEQESHSNHYILCSYKRTNFSTNIKNQWPCQAPFFCNLLSNCLHAYLMFRLILRVNWQLAAFLNCKIYLADITTQNITWISCIRMFIVHVVMWPCSNQIIMPKVKKSCRKFSVIWFKSQRL